jgi:DNA replication initiation complex subunit (GINS family)
MLSYSKLRDIQKKESDSADIVKLDPAFWSDAAIFIADKKKEAMNGESILAIKEYENIRKIVASIQMRREEKIVLMAVRGEKDMPGLTKEEGSLLRDISERIHKCRDEVSDIWNGKKTDETTKKVRILKDIEPYTGLDNNTYGPFSSGDEPLLPLAEAQWLIKSKMAEGDLKKVKKENEIS